MENIELLPDFNIDEVKTANRVEKFIKDEGYKIKLEYGAFPDRPYDSKAVWGSNKKIMEILNEKNY